MKDMGQQETAERWRRGRRHGGQVASVVVLVLLSHILAAQQAVRGQRGKAAAHAVVNFKELAQREALAPKQAVEPVMVPFLRTPRRTPPAAGAAAQPSAPALKAAPAPLVPSPSPAASFEAMADNDTAIPPDTQGAVGPNHLMVALNNGVRIQNRSGTEISQVTLATFWNSTGASGVFDPKLRYDPFADRWIFCAVSDRRSAASSVLMGVSQTSDPTGNWFLYKVDADDTDVNWADYPTPGFNKDWIAVAVNMFAITTPSPDAYAQSNIYVFSKADLYANATSPGLTLFSDPDGGSQAPAATYDNNLATLYLVEDLNGSFNGKGYLRISTVSGDVGSESYSGGTATPNVTSPWAEFPPNGDDFAPQLGSAQKIQNNDARILNVVYRNGSLWAAQSAFLPDTAPTHTAAQWWQLSPNGTVQQFGRVEDTNGALFYAFPTIAVNSQSDVLLGYSIFAADQYAAAGYSFRGSGDAANTMRSSITLKAGEAAYYKTFSGTRNRWGDYSATVVDPVNDLDMWTIQEYASSPDFGNGDNRWGTWWGKIAVSPAPVKHRRSQLVSE
jgi:hypothetical protein